jgi:putative ABC transport system substrate-binding protein
MIDRRNCALALAASLLARPPIAGAQSAGKVWRIGFLGISPAGTSRESERLIAAFTQVLRDSGFVEGQNMVLERRAEAGQIERGPALVAELIGLRVDILVIGSASVRAAMEATSTIPIVFLNLTDPVRSGIVASFARPGGNVTGVTGFSDDLVPKRLELLKAAAPRTARVAFFEPTQNLRAEQVDALKKDYEAAALALGIGLRRYARKTPQHFANATAAIVAERADSLLVGDSQTSFILRKEIADFAIRQRLPAMVSSRTYLTGGALMSYGPDPTDNWRKGAAYVAKILNGARPADLPVQRPTKVELLINLKTAKAIGLTIPQALLLRADEVIE